MSLHVSLSLSLSWSHMYTCMFESAHFVNRAPAPKDPPTHKSTQLPPRYSRLCLPSSLTPAYMQIPHRARRYNHGARVVATLEAPGCASYPDQAAGLTALIEAILHYALELELGSSAAEASTDLHLG